MTRPVSTRKKTIPAAFKRHWRVFSEERLGNYRPIVPWDHKIELLPTAPNVINSKVYPLAPKEQEALNQYLEENLEKGYHRRIFVPAMDPQPSWSKRRTGPCESCMITIGSMNSPSWMSPPLPRILSILEDL